MTAASVWNLEIDLHAYAMDPPCPLPEVDDSELCLYRGRTVNILRRYLRLSMETGRLPSLLGNLHFRARVSNYPLKTFEDAVIFVLDVEHCLREQDDFSQELLARIVLQEYTPEDAARMLQCSVRSVERRLPEALDELTKTLLFRGILSRSKISPTSCQGSKNGYFPPSPWKDDE
jgi:hypothetical protein